MAVYSVALRFVLLYQALGAGSEVYKRNHFAYFYYCGESEYVNRTGEQICVTDVGKCKCFIDDCVTFCTPKYKYLCTSSASGSGFRILGVIVGGIWLAVIVVCCICDQCRERCKSKTSNFSNSGQTTSLTNISTI